jgi:hypothetical protein
MNLAEEFYKKQKELRDFERRLGLTKWTYQFRDGSVFTRTYNSGLIETEIKKGK